MTTNTPLRDLAGTSYWNDTWARSDLPKTVDLRQGGRWGFPNRKIEQLMRRWLEPARGGRLLELGCARSIWLPYWARQLDFTPTGVDYSELGCEQTRSLLATAGVDGRVICADFFQPPAELVGAYDIVMSFGVVEHFDDTRACIEGFARYLAPGGLMFTLVPNMTGLPGYLQKQLNLPVFEKHVPLDCERLTRAHRDAGLHIEESNYLVSSNFGVVNLDGLPRNAGWLAKKALMSALCRASLLSWYVDERLVALPPTSLLSPYVYCVAKRG